ncbi:hypothetical protein GGS21DRAFT_173432 [Xylaria nigripes]|nr:hypothetical protein GGS21DRAFT_173432 [Xylaria nigripes]
MNCGSLICSLLMSSFLCLAFLLRTYAPEKSIADLLYVACFTCNVYLYVQCETLNTVTMSSDCRYEVLRALEKSDDGSPVYKSSSAF